MEPLVLLGLVLAQICEDFFWQRALRAKAGWPRGKGLEGACAGRLPTLAAGERVLSREEDESSSLSPGVEREGESRKVSLCKRHVVSLREEDLRSSAQ